jgi:hypothetical protein
MTMMLIAEGEITTSEAARILGLHYATVKALGINPKQARRDLLARLAACASKFAPLFDMVYGGRCADRLP